MMTIRRGSAEFLIVSTEKRSMSAGYNVWKDLSRKTYCLRVKETRVSPFEQTEKKGGCIDPFERDTDDKKERNVCRKNLVDSLFPVE